MLVFFVPFSVLLASLSVQAALPEESYSQTIVASELNSPWSMVSLPSGIWLITERDGHVVVIDSGEQTRINLGLDELFVAGQGGLLDIVLSPDFAQTGQIFVSYAQGNADANRLAVASLLFDGNSFSKPKVIFATTPDKSTPVHYAGRLLFMPDSTLLIASGDGFDYREKAQVKSNQLGKLLRINLDGTIPEDNPFVAMPETSAHAVYSYGHRNPQGLIIDSDTLRLFSHEHGPAGGDELNLIMPGVNYGWPAVTLGKDYTGARISPFTEYHGMQKPMVNWTPSIAPSGMAYYAGEETAFPSLQKHALVTTLVDKVLYAIDLNNNQYTQQKAFADITGRLRDVVVTASGEVALLTDGAQAQLILLAP